MKSITPRLGETLLELAKACDAVYICPKEGSWRKGPLVAYAGKDSKGRNLVGDIYFNFRKIESHPEVVTVFAEAARKKLSDKGLLDTFDTVCGIPHGGRTFGQELARITGKRFAYADKRLKPTEAGRKQEYTWDLSQFEFEEGERVAVADDVFNNFQNTDNTLSAIADTGARVILLVGALNRSPVYEEFYTPANGGTTFPVVASVREAYPEYQQDDPEVAADIAAGRLELDVKRNWRQLCAFMNQ